MRIAQGALANVREHADATAAAITLTHLGDQVVLDIADNGRGFTPELHGSQTCAGTAFRRSGRARGSWVAR